MLNIPADLGGVHKLRLQYSGFFFDHLPPSVYIFYVMKVYKKSIFLTTYPSSSCKRSLWTAPYCILAIDEHQYFKPTKSESL